LAQELEEIEQKDVKRLSFALCHDPAGCGKDEKTNIKRILNKARLVKLAHIIEKTTLRNPRGKERFARLEKNEQRNKQKSHLDAEMNAM
jgi:hypothetical protein